MEIEFDPAKDSANVAKHGLSLQRTGELETIAVTEATRREDEERRFRLYGLLRGDAYCAVLTWRGGAPRVVSRRKANRMERKRLGLQSDD